MSIPSGQELPQVPAILTESPFNPKQSVNNVTMLGIVETLNNPEWRDAHPTEALRGLQLLACNSSTNWLVAGLFQEIIADYSSKLGQDLPRQLFSHFCKEGMQQEAIDLLKNGLPVDHLNESGQNILIEAMDHNLADLVKAIVDGKTIEKLPVNSHTATLALACQRGYSAVISQLVELDPELLERVYRDLTPLGNSLLFGTSSSVIQLVYLGASPEVCLGRGPTSSEGEPTLVIAEASPGWLEGEDSVDVFIKGIHEEASSCTLDEGDLFLNAVAASGTAKTLDWLVARGCDPKLVDTSGRNLVHASTKSRDENTISWVLLNADRLQLDVNLKDYHERTPLNLFCQQSFRGFKGSPIESIKTFHAAGADLNIPDRENRRPLIALMQQKEWESIAFLINNGASLLIPTAEHGGLVDETLHDYAVMTGSQDPLAALTIISQATQVETAHQLYELTQENPGALSHYPGAVIAIALLDPPYRQLFLDRLEYAMPSESINDSQRLKIISAALRKIFQPAELMKYLGEHPKVQKALSPYLGEAE